MLPDRSHPLSENGLPKITDRILLGSGGYFGKPETIDFLRSQFDDFLGASVKDALIIPYAQSEEDFPRLNQNIEKYNLITGRSFTRIDTQDNQKRAIEKAGSIIIFGGNTFRLLDALYRHSILGPIREKVLQGLPYIGISAGTNVACPTLMTTNDMPIVLPPSYNALNLIPFQINPHYVSGPFYFKHDGTNFEKYANETRDDRIHEFHSLNSLDVIGLPEGTFLQIKDGKMIYLNKSEKTGNSNPLRLFRKGQSPVDFLPQTDVTGINR